MRHNKTVSNDWKGLVLAGGKGSRLFPATKVVNKHLLQVYDKPLIYYSLSTLMLCGIRDIVIVSSHDSLMEFERLLGDGSQWGISFEYCEQNEPKGIVDAVNSAKHSLNGKNVALTLGDNIFYGAGLVKTLKRAVENNQGATIFGYQVKDPSAYGVIVLDENRRPKSIVEKPHSTISNIAVPGLYFYDCSLFSKTSNIKASERGEFEITEVNQIYLQENSLQVCLLGRGIAWLDAGTAEDLFDASQFMKVLEDRTGVKISCPEEIAWRQNWISSEELSVLVESCPDGDYKKFLLSLLSTER